MTTIAATEAPATIGDAPAAAMARAPEEEIVLLASGGPTAPLRLVRRQGGAIIAHGEADDAKALADLDAEGVATHLVLPGEVVAARLIETPVRGAARMRAAAAFALEDDLAEDVEALHVAIGEAATEEGGAARLAVAYSRDQLKDWIEAIEDTGLQLVSVLPDFLTVDLYEKAWAVQLDAGRAVVRLNGAGGFACEAELAAPLLADLAAAGAEDAAQAPAIIVRGASDDVQRFAKVLREAGADVRAQPGAEDAPGAWAHPVRATAANLLQGEFALRVDWFGAVRPWRRAGLLAALALVVAMSVTLVEGLRLSSAANRLEAEAEALFREAYPDTRIVNISAQARQRASAASSGEFLSISASLSTALQKVEAVDLEAMRYDGGAGAVTATVGFSTYEDLEALKAAVGEAGARLEEGAARREGERFVGDVTISMNGGGRR